MRLFIFALFFAPAQSFAIPGDDCNPRSCEKLFRIVKPFSMDGQRNDLMIEAKKEGCTVRGLDFRWYMHVNPGNDNPEFIKPSSVEGMIRDRFPPSATKPDNAASCAKAVPPGTKCNSFSVSVSEMGWVDHGLRDPSLVVRAELVGGVCTVGAYLDLNGRAIRLKAMKVNATNIKLKKVFGVTTGADFTVDRVSILPVEGDPVTFRCTRNCQKSEP